MIAKVKGPTCPLSNFYMHPIPFDGNTFPSAEHTSTNFSKPHSTTDKNFAYLSILIACPKNDGMFSRAQNAKNILLCTRLSKIFLFDTHVTFREQIWRTFFHACKQLPISGILMLTTALF